MPNIGPTGTNAAPALTATSSTGFTPLLTPAVKPAAPPSFSGDDIHTDVYVWCRRIARFFEYQGLDVNNSRHTFLIENSLTGSAAIFFDTICVQMGTLLTPTMALDELRRRFGPSSKAGTSMARAELVRLKYKGPGTFQSYLTNFNRIVGRIPFMSDEEQKQAFIEHLGDYCWEVFKHDPPDLEAAIKFMELHDAYLVNTKDLRHNRSRRYKTDKVPDKNNKPCARCHRNGHDAATCRAPAPVKQKVASIQQKESGNDEFQDA